MAIKTLELDYIRSLVREKAAIIVDSDKGYLVESRLLPLARKEGFATLDDFITKLRTAPYNVMHRKVVDAMTTNETSFFRDVHPFESLKTEILPKMIEARAKVRQLSFWCGASSTGQEPYSICMLMREHFPQLATWKIDFLATDLSRDVLDKARAGKFSQLEVNRGLPAPMLLKYFARQGVEWQIKDEVRSLMTFREQNLMETWNIPYGLDIVFLRNVMIYFDVETKKQILGNIRRHLKPDGYLFLGGAETTLNLDDKFERVRFDKTWCYRPLA